MFIWELNQSVQVLTQFRERVLKYFRNLQTDPNTGNVVETTETLSLRQMINQMIAQVENAFNRTTVPLTVIQTLPLQGFHGPVNLVSNIFNLPLSDRTAGVD